MTRWRQPIAGYGALALVVAGPLLGSGLLLAVDAAPVPHPQLNPSYWGLGQGTHEGTLSRLPLDAFLTVLGSLASVAAAQKLILVAAVFLAGWGMHRAVEVRNGPARVFAGLLYAINPFVYDRIWTGQLYIVLGYALLPWAFAAFRALVRGRSRSAWPFVALALATGIASSHMAVLLGVLCVCTLGACLVARPSGARRLAPALIAALLAAAASTWWLLPTPGVSELWSHVGKAQLVLYESIADPRYGLIPTLAALSGYWNDARPAISHLPAWPALALTLIVLMAGGAWVRRRDALTWGVLAAAAIGFALALGFAWGPTRTPFAWLLAHVSPLRSFRESEKGLALVAFAYAYLGAGAVDEIVGDAGRARQVVTALLLAVPIVFGSRMLWGASGQLHTSRYPSAWTSAERYLTRHAQRSLTLVLPFHGYFSLSFAHDRVVANPASAFFSTPVLVGESVGGPNDQSDPTQMRVQQLLRTPSVDPSFSSCLAALGVGRILVLHQADWTTYGNLARRPGIAVERNWPGVTLYRSARPASLVMARTGVSRGCADWTPVPALRDGALGVRLLASPPAGAPLRVEMPNGPSWERSGPRSFTFKGWSAYRRNYIVGVIVLLLVLAAATGGRLRPGFRRRVSVRDGSKLPVAAR